MPQLLTPQEAAALVRDVDTVGIPLGPGHPVAFLHAMGAREAYEDLAIGGALLTDVYEVFGRPGVQFLSGFFGPLERLMAAQGGAVSFVPGDFRRFAPALEAVSPRIMSTIASPPDDEGYCSLSLHAGATVGEIHRAGADPNRILLVEVSDPDTLAGRSLETPGDVPVRPGASGMEAAAGQGTRTIDFSATVAGELYGIGVVMDEPRVYASAQTTFPVNFDWFNNGVEGDATLTVDQDSLPDGVTVSGPPSVSIHLAPGETKPWASLQFSGPPQDPPVVQSYDLPPPDQEPVIRFTLTQRSSQGVQTTRYAIPVHVGGVTTFYNFVDWAQFPGRAHVFHKYYVKLSTDGSWMTWIKVGADDYENDHSCFRYYDNTTVAISPFKIFTHGGVFHNGNWGGINYYDAGVSGGLKDDYDDTVRGFHADYRVSCEHSNY